MVLDMSWLMDAFPVMILPASKCCAMELTGMDVIWRMVTSSFAVIETYL